jgi:hypothetical protein
MEKGRIPELESTRENAEYWERGARQMLKEGASVEEIMQCWMQSTNAWKNAAYAMADKWYAART